MARSGRVGQGVLGLVLPVLLASCGAPFSVLDAPPRAPAYDGPLYVEVTAPATDDQADRSGAAGRVVQCVYDHVGYSDGQPNGPEEAALTADGALGTPRLAYVRPAVKEGVFRVREEEDRVLYTYEVGIAAKIAIVVHRARVDGGRTGWYVESWARCDAAEFPDPGVIGLADLQFWTHPSGERAATYQILTFDSVSCMPGTRWLNLDGGDFEGGQTYVRGAGPEYADWFAEEWVDSMTRPKDAVPTGYSRDGQTLWLSPDGKRAYVGTESGVEMWPATTQDLGCA